MFEAGAREEAPADLAKAAELYRGDLLGEDCATANVETWFAPYRAECRRKALQLVERLSSADVLDGAQELAQGLRKPRCL